MKWRVTVKSTPWHCNCGERPQPVYHLYIDDIEQIGVCRAFADWFKEKFPNGADLRKVWDSIESPDWLSYFVYVMPDSIGKEIMMVSDEYGDNLSNWSDHVIENKKEACDLFREIVPLELVFETEITG
jgi:hypothetical protein